MTVFVRISTLIAACLALSVGACKDTPKGKLSAADKPVAGDSCAGLDESTAAMACDGQKMLFCSSFTEYKWRLEETCAEGATCSLAEDGKSAMCK